MNKTRLHNKGTAHPIHTGLIQAKRTNDTVVNAADRLVRIARSHGDERAIKKAELGATLVRCTFRIVRIVSCASRKNPEHQFDMS